MVGQTTRHTHKWHCLPEADISTEWNSAPIKSEPASKCNNFIDRGILYFVLISTVCILDCLITNLQQIVQHVKEANLSKAKPSGSHQSRLNPRLSALHILYWMIETL